MFRLVKFATSAILLCVTLAVATPLLHKNRILNFRELVGTPLLQKSQPGILMCDLISKDCQRDLAL